MDEEIGEEEKMGEEMERKVARGDDHFKAGRRTILLNYGVRICLDLWPEERPFRAPR
jgi:hypothetical protein